MNKAFLKIDCSSMVASRYVDGKFTGEQTKIETNSEESRAQMLFDVNEFRMKGFEE